jgi:CAAX prenyl protease-like protein
MPGPGPQKQVKASGWAPYWAPYVSFLLIVELSGRVTGPFAPVFLVMRVLVPLGLLVYYGLRDGYPELRGARFGAWTIADVAVGLVGALLWIAPFLLFDSLRPSEPGLDLGQLGPGGEWFVLTLRAIGYVAVTPFVEELFVRSWLLRYVDVAETRKPFRAVPIAQFSWRSCAVVTVWFVFSHAQFEWGVMFVWTALTMAWFYYRKHLAPIVLVHAVTNGAIFAFVIWFDGAFRDASGAPISLWFFL